jgi:hypothetical protein
MRPYSTFVTEHLLTSFQVDPLFLQNQVRLICHVSEST